MVGVLLHQFRKYGIVEFERIGKYIMGHLSWVVISSSNELNSRKFGIVEFEKTGSDLWAT